MTLSPAERTFVAGMFQLERPHGMTEREFDELVDAWYAHDHYDGNPAYAYDNESCSHG